MTLVVDASAALVASAAKDGFRVFAGDRLIAPPHMWAEARSGLHEALWRGEIDEALALGTFDNLQKAPIRSRTPPALAREAWKLADDFGWAKTYDAEYVALAQLSSCRLVTEDGRLRRRTQHLGFVISLATLDIHL